MKSCLFALALLVLPAVAQQPRKFVIDNTPEGQILKQIGEEMDEGRKLALMEDFVAKYPKHDGAGWVYSQMQPLLLKKQEYDKALDAGEKALAASPEDLNSAYNNLKAAEGKKDADLVVKWSAQTSERARKISGSDKAPADDDEKQRIEYAKQVDTYSEYALYAMALQGREPKQTVELVDALIQRNPKSQYLGQVSGSYLNALIQSGQSAKACPAADKLAANDPKDTDSLLFAADCSLQRNQADRAVSYATRAQEALGSKPKPEGMSDSDWASKKSAMFGRANWIAGVGYGAVGKYGPANKALRAALPSVQGNSQLTATALFYLGLSNYQLGKTLTNRAQMREGLHYFEQCAAIKSPVQDQAEKNVRAIRSELGGR